MDWIEVTPDTLPGDHIVKTKTLFGWNVMKAKLSYDDQCKQKWSVNNQIVTHYLGQVMNINISDEWVVTDPNNNQRYKIVTDGHYLFEEDRIDNPVTKSTYKYTRLMSIDNYTLNVIIEACEAFGYTSSEVENWIILNEEIPLMLECLFEMS